MSQHRPNVNLPPSVESFAQSAEGLSRNPLGIIALFIVLVYGMACIVIVFGAEKLKGDFERLPLVWFLALFPVLVLVVFSWLVSRHHTKLYAPVDFDDQTIFEDLAKSKDLANPPHDIANSIDIGVAATHADMKSEIQPNPSIRDDLDTRYDSLKDGYWLIHAAEIIRLRTVPGSGIYRVRIWLEGWQDEPLRHIKSVTYRFWTDVTPNAITTNNRNTKFDAWMHIYGEFPVLARVELQDGTILWLTQYLDLPGRPPD